MGPRRLPARPQASGQPGTVHDLLLQKRDGTFELVVWGERFTGGIDRVTVSLDATFPSVMVYDPTVGLSPVRSLTDVGSVELELGDRPAIIEIPPGPPSPATPATGAAPTR